MSVVITAAILVNLCLFAAILVWSLRQISRNTLAFSRGLLWALSAVIFVLMTGAAARLMFQGVGAGWLREDLWRTVAPIWEMWQAAAATGAGLLALWAVRTARVQADPAERLVTAMARRLPDVAEAISCLTPRERQVVATLARGQLKDVELAGELGMSSQTAATHVRNMLAKTGLHSRRDLAVLGFVVAERDAQRASRSAPWRQSAPH